MTSNRAFSTDLIKEVVLKDLPRLLKPWMVGRPEGYTLDTATQHLIALGYWLDEELHLLGINEKDRRTQVWKFNRLSRTYDLWESALECINDALTGTVQQNRIGHRRWG